MKRVAIFGRTPDPAAYLKGKGDFECWGLNDLYRIRRDIHWTRWFEIHDFKMSKGTWLRRGSSEFRGMKVDSYLSDLGALNIPVYMKDFNPLVPNAVKYPIEEVVDEFGNYIGGTPCYMIAMAIKLGFEEIAMFGAKFTGVYLFERPSVEYFLGIARGRGIKIYISPDTNLLSSSRVYGF